MEAGKKAAGAVIALRARILDALRAAPGEAFTAESLAARLGAPESTELVFKVLEHLAANPGSGVAKQAKRPWHESRYSLRGR